MEIVVPSPSAVRSLTIEWLLTNRAEIAIVAGIAVFAAVVRLINVGDVPAGLHGDEAIAGLEARSLVDNGELAGGLSPYSLGARGVPAGTFYWAAPFLGLFGDSVAVLRASYAMLGVGSVLFTYLAFRVMFTRTVATVAAVLLAVSVWHLHYSRAAFIPIGWPLMEMATLFFLFLGIKRQSRWAFAAAGACLGGGIYTYQAFSMFAIALVPALIAIGLIEYRERMRPYLNQIVILGGTALLVGLPMALYALDNSEHYKARYEEYSVTRTQEYKDAGNVFDKAGVLIDREWDYVTSLVSDPAVDAVDAAGSFPLVDWLTALLILSGTALALRAIRKAEYATLLILIAVIGAGPALAEEGSFRRTLGLTPLLAGLAALPLAMLWEEGAKRGAQASLWMGLAVFAVVGGVAGIGFERYFTAYDDDPEVRWVYAADLADASRYIDNQAAGTYVLFYNDRHSFNYETRRFIAPDIEGEDRSQEFTDPATGNRTLTADRTKDTLYVFMGGYVSSLEEVKGLYPGGTEHVERNPDGSVIFAAYFVPLDPNAEPPPPPTPGPTPTPQAGGDDRDAIRVGDLEAVRAALEGYRNDNGSYPETGGSIQSLCAFEGLDAGCALFDVLDPLPVEPLGNPALNGYWYASDGDAFVVYAQREADVAPACDEHPDHLGQFSSVMCVRGPEP